MISFQKYRFVMFSGGSVVRIVGSLLLTTHKFVSSQDTTPAARTQHVLFIIRKCIIIIYVPFICLPSSPISLFHSALMESLITPLQDKIEDWKKTANQLDKDHAKGTKTAQFMMQMQETKPLLISSPCFPG